MKPKVDGYSHEKLLVAFKAFQQFLDSIGEDSWNTSIDWETRELLALPTRQFEELIEKKSSKLSEQDLAAIRLAIALLRFGMKQYASSKKFCSLPDALNSELSKFISLSISSKLGLSFPDQLNEEQIEEIRVLCEYAWNGDASSSKYLQRVWQKIKMKFS